MSGVYALSCKVVGCGYSDVRYLDKPGSYLCQFGRHGYMNVKLIEYVCRCKRFTGSSICRECPVCRSVTRLSSFNNMVRVTNSRTNHVYYKCTVCGRLSSTNDCMECFLKSKQVKAGEKRKKGSC